MTEQLSMHTWAKEQQRPCWIVTLCDKFPWELAQPKRVMLVTSCLRIPVYLLHVQNSSSGSNHHICILGDIEDWGQRRFPETATWLIWLYFKSHCINVWPHLAARKARTVFFILAVKCWVLSIRKKVRMNIRADSHQSLSACQLDAYSNTNSSSGLLLFSSFYLHQPSPAWKYRAMKHYSVLHYIMWLL